MRLTVVGVTLAAVSAVFWLPAMGKFLVVADPLEPAEMVLPLAGDLYRVGYAAELYRAGYARRLLLTNLPLPTETARDAHLRRVLALAEDGGVAEAAVEVVPPAARTTFGEAQNVRAQLGRGGVRSLLVVTSPWHTRRARGALRAAFRGSGVRVVVRPVPPAAQPYPYEASAWWRTPDARRAVLSEYLKLAASAVGIR